MTQEKDNQAPSFAQDSPFKADQVLETIRDAFFSLDAEYRFAHVNRETERVLFKSREELLGRYIWEVFPEGEGSTFDLSYRRAVAEGVPVTFEEFYPPLGMWFDVRVYPSEGGLSVFYQDVTARRRAQEALRRSQEDLLLAIDAARLGTFYCDWPLDKIVWNQTCKEHFFLPPDAEVDFTLFYSLLHPDDREPTRQAIERALSERAAYNVEYRTLAPDGRTRWVNAVGRFYYDDNGTPTRFDGITIDISARKVLEEERSRFVSLADNSTDFIGMSDMDDVPFYVNPAGLRMVGLADMDQARRARGIEFFWEEDRPFLLNDLVPRVLRDGHGHAEVRLRHFGTGAPIWVNYTLLTLTDGSGRPVGLATVSRDISERKALEAERERLAEREHNIAQQLQSALQPEVPRAMPGLNLAKYYEAALAEAGVGGDFYDVFPLEKGRTVLAVGDLSGKGLEAAAQVATVRNMLRAFLYTRRSLVEAVIDLNRVLALNDLLSAFATLWVGCFDAPTGQMVYVNCGQEPALLRRAATGAVEPLPPTGPVLGADGNASFQERIVALAPGDVLAVFTDGATECGPSRREMLGVEGVAALIAPPFAPEETEGAERMAEAVALRLVAGVDMASQGGVARDDICILVAVAQGDWPGSRFRQV